MNEQNKKRRPSLHEQGQNILFHYLPTAWEDKGSNADTEYSSVFCLFINLLRFCIVLVLTHINLEETKSRYATAIQQVVDLPILESSKENFKGFSTHTNLKCTL